MKICLLTSRNLKIFGTDQWKRNNVDLEIKRSQN